LVLGLEHRTSDMLRMHGTNELLMKNNF
jgi:hypothetical protein